MYGWHPCKRSFPSWVAGEIAAGRPVRVVDGQSCTPTLAASLAGALVALAERGERGLFHVAGAECATRLVFARAAARAFGLDEGLVDAIRPDELRQLAPRPAYSCLDSSRAARRLGYRPLGLAEGLARLRGETPAV